MEPSCECRKQFDINVIAAPWAVAIVLGIALVQPAAAQLLDTVERQIESGVVETVERQVEAGVVDTVEAQVESSVIDAVEQQVAADVANSVEQAVEGDVVDGVQRQVEQGVLGVIEDQVESRVSDAIGNRVVGTVTAADDRLHDAAAPGAPRGRRGRRGDDGGPADGRRRAAFAQGVDAEGRAVERQTWVILVPAQYAQRIAGWGFTIRERSDLATLDRVLLRVDAPEDRDIAQAALELALDAPGTLVDFNHLYRPGAESAPASFAARPAAVVSAAVRPAPSGAKIGLIDSAVASDHEALRAANIEQRDFVPYAGPRPLEHGTAVASIIVGDSQALHPPLAGARLYAASVFFADGERHPAAAAASLVAALDWLAANGVRTVNMSLAGPPNSVLEGAVKQAVEGGAVIVAAVGNNGPVGGPLYPAAYESVVGVTAVDAGNRVYRYANRGRQVTFAAPGVKVKVARSAGGYGVETGTSLAAPYAAAIIASSLALRAEQPADRVVAALESAAIDLGDKDFDEVFGYGLIAAMD